MESLSGRKVLVTGASSGIGEAIARACAADGARVACMARRADRLIPLANEIGGHAVVMDLSDRGTIPDAVDQAARDLGGLDAVVNNAGVYLLGGVTDGRLDDWEQMFEINVLALLAVVQAALPHLRRSERADVVNMSSMGGRRVSRPSAAVYCATKFAVNALSDGMRQELSPDGVRVTIISPGVVRTDVGAETGDEALLRDFRSKQEEFGLDPSVIARQVVRVLAEPPEVNLFEVAVLPTAQPG